MTFPNAQFINIVRDGCDVAASYVDAQIYPNIRQAADRWRRSVQAAGEFCSRFPNQCIEIRYEALVRDPQATVAAICQFLGADYDISMLEPTNREHLGDAAVHEFHKSVSKPIFRESIGKGRSSLTLAEREIVQDTIGGELRRQDYAPCM